MQAASNAPATSNHSSEQKEEFFFDSITPLRLILAKKKKRSSRDLNASQSLERAYLGDSTAISDSFYNSIKQSNSTASELSPVPDNTVDRLDQLKLTFSRSELRIPRLAGL
jgi:hypothetical protein